MSLEADLETQVRLLMDEREIRRVLADYCKAIDRADADRMSACFHPDAQIDVGSFQATGSEIGTVICQKSAQGKVLTMYTSLTTDTVDIQGDEAWAVSYHVSIRKNDVSGDVVVRWLGERCLDRFERRDGEWR